MITYSTNFMGPISKYWYAERGLLHKVNKIANANQAKFWKINEGDEFTVLEVTTHYAGGRIDIRDHTKEGYGGWNEYAVMPMHGEDWNALSEYLDELETETLVSYDELIKQFENQYGKSIRWAPDPLEG